MLRRNDLCEQVARRMWIEILEMNFCKGRASLVNCVMEGHPRLDRAKVFEMVYWMWAADN